MSKKKEDEIAEAFRNEKSMELFNKKEYELEYADKVKLEQYINDLNNPKWGPIYAKGKLLPYEVSNTGMIRNTNSEVILKLGDWQGYSRVTLYADKKYYPVKVHRLVALAFIPNPGIKPQINHINGNKKCNWVGNLEWTTAKENIRHAWDSGLHDNFAKGERVGTSKYTEADVRKVCEMLCDPHARYEDIEKATGVSYDAIAKIATGDNWGWISNEYNFPTARIRPSKYSEEEIRNICQMLANGVKPVEIHNLTNIPWTTLSQIKNRRSYTHISSEYAF